MKYTTLGKSDLNASSIILGCMRINSLNEKELTTLINTSIEEGINLFDHADIYGNGSCEELFGNVLNSNPGLRDKILLQSKCSIRNGFYDLSKDHILTSVDNSLNRLQTDYLDLLILHRPDTLMEPEEIAEAFTKLSDSGKVKNFGISNFNSIQIELLKKYIDHPLIVNQLQFGIMHSDIVNNGIQVNTSFPGSIDRADHILEYSRLNDITIQAWSPFQYGFFEGIFIDNDKFPELNKTLATLAEKYNVSKSAIAVAWIMRHPANMQTLIGTTKINRIKDICTANSINLSREEWYSIYKAAGNILP